MQGTTKHCFILNIQALGLVVSEKKIFSRFSHYKPIADNDPPPLILATLDPKGHGWQDL